MNEVVRAGAELVKPPQKCFGAVTQAIFKILMAIFGNWHTISLRELDRRARRRFVIINTQQ
jgi:hypothetical protein